MYQVTEYDRRPRGYNTCNMQVTIHFWGDLNFFLSSIQHEQEITIPFTGRSSIKHLVEAVGVPHTEVQTILINRAPAELSNLVDDGDRIEVFPAVHRLLPSAEPHFILDNHLGKLATYLRILGFDCTYRNDLQDGELVQLSSQAGQTLLTRDRRLLMHKVITSGYCVRALDPEAQLIEVVLRFDLQEQIKPFHRCLRCNSLLEPVRKETILPRLEPLTRLYFDEFHRCPNCDRIYWKGSHYEHMSKLIENARKSG